MTQSQIFTPFLGMLVLTLAVWIFMYSKRLPFIFANRFDPNEMTPDEFNRLSPIDVRNPSDNLKNLFEVPIVFYVLCLFLFVTEQVDIIYVIAAWIFFLFRICHSVVHCLTSNVMLRFTVYCVAAAAVWFMVLRVTWRLVVS